METFLVGLQGFAHGQSVYMFSSSGVKVIFLQNHVLCFEANAELSTTQCPEIVRDNTGSGRKRD